MRSGRGKSSANADERFYRLYLFTRGKESELQEVFFLGSRQIKWSREAGGQVESEVGANETGNGQDPKWPSRKMGKVRLTAVAKLSHSGF